MSGEHPRSRGRTAVAGVPGGFAVNPTLLAVIGLLLFLGFWEGVSRLGWMSPIFLPPPSSIPEAFWREVTSGIWLDRILKSLDHYLKGLVLGSALGVLLGIATGMSRLLEGLTAWIIRVLRPIPGLAWVPFAILWFQISPAAATFIVGVGVFWINYYSTLAAVQGVDSDLIELADSFGHRSRLVKLVKVVLPASTPGILAGVRTGLGQAWMSVVAAELFGVAGLGQRMNEAATLLASDIVVVYMLTMALLYGMVDALFVLVRSRLLKWRP
ncbi:ABC transporter permease [Oleomonas cavernae]|uniref:ABC transporter permease n=1 Tax=Oleomonas cavernae TaxID=2320859 RepID=A0A418WGJ9_9PROT|nr:ABC transporter permease [Oleomonas cavernae]RJF89108.1 ABC transporter permease [Oleomonas cavernae]